VITRPPSSWSAMPVCFSVTDMDLSTLKHASRWRETSGRHGVHEQAGVRAGSVRPPVVYGVQAGEHARVPVLGDAIKCGHNNESLFIGDMGGWPGAVDIMVLVRGQKSLP
jgi:hypothetical protein